jgi:hypothetical protein
LQFDNKLCYLCTDNSLLTLNVMVMREKLQYSAYFVFSPLGKIAIVLGVVAALGLAITGFFSVIAIMY